MTTNKLVFFGAALVCGIVLLGLVTKKLHFNISNASSDIERCVMNQKDVQSNPGQSVGALEVHSEEGQGMFNSPRT